MAQNTTTPTPFNTSIQKWITLHKDAINTTANRLGVPASAIAAAMGEEASHIIYDAPTVTAKGRVVSARQNFSDAGQDFLARSGFRDYLFKDYAKDYADREPEIRLGLNSSKSAFRQLGHPTAMDVGWGNVNVGTAILTLQQYLARTRAGERYSGDPLGLSQYADNYSKLARDLANPRSDLTVKMAGLLLSQADEVFSNAYQKQYHSLPEQDQSSLLVTAYKQGLNKIISKIEDFPSGDLPPLPDPKAGDGAATTALNFPLIKRLLSGNIHFDAPIQGASTTGKVARAAPDDNRPASLTRATPVLAPLSSRPASPSPPSSPEADVPHWLENLASPQRGTDSYATSRFVPVSSSGSWFGSPQLDFGAFKKLPQGDMGKNSDPPPSSRDRFNPSASNPLIGMGLLHNPLDVNQAPVPTQAAPAALLPQPATPTRAPSSEPEAAHWLTLLASPPLSPSASGVPPWPDPEAVGKGLRRLLGLPE